MKLRAFLCAAAIGFNASASVAETSRGPLPQWLNNRIAQLRASHSLDVVEQSSYEGKRTFLFTSGTRFDSGDEHTLFSEDGASICQFGGFVGHVTRGSCDIAKITYVRTIYAAKRD